MKDEIHLTVRLPGLVHIAVVQRAKAEHRSLNAQIVHELSERELPADD